MTYNVFGGILNIAQSISRKPWSKKFIFDVQVRLCPHTGHVCIWRSLGQGQGGA